MIEQRTSLNGKWQFRADPSRIGPRTGLHDRSVTEYAWEVLPVPGAWDQHGKDGDEGAGWYRREFELPRAASGKRRGICLAGINDSARVWLNGVEVANESPLRQRFAFSIDGRCQPGKNTIVIRVPDRGVPGGMLQAAWLGPYRRIDELLPGVQHGSSARPSADWVRDAVVYEVHLRAFSTSGTFLGLQRRLDQLHRLGVTVIWLMPIHPIGKTRRKGTLGSPYSVSDYYACNPELGSPDDFAALLAAAHQRGMRLIIDLVANHAAWDSALIRRHPEWFARDERGGIRSPFEGWSDVAQLDYNVPELRQYMLKMMLHWVRDVGVDGFRCDVAGMVPSEFWNDAREKLEAVKPVMMLAEDDQPAQHLRAFDLTYDWRTYQALGRLRSGRLSPASIDAILTNERLDFPDGSLRLRFSSNHDLCAWHKPALKRYWSDGAKAAAILTYALPGVPLIYNGQEAGNNASLWLFERVTINWKNAPDHDLGGLYSFLGRLRHQRRSLRRGETEVLSTLPDKHILGIARRWQDETTCVLINCALETCELEADALLPSGAETLLGTTTPTERGSGRTIELPPLGAWIGAAR